MSGFDRLTGDGQTPSLTDLAREALARFGVPRDANLELLKYRENAVFGVTDSAGGDRYVLRMHRPGYHTDDEIRSELGWMRAINKSGIHTPDVIPGRDGEFLQLVPCEVFDAPLQCDLFGWVEGTALGAIEEGGAADKEELVGNFRLLGQLAGRLHNHSERWQPPEGFTRHSWDAEGICGEEPVWGRFWELEPLTDQQRDLLVRARDEVRSRLVAFGKGPDRYGLIHADFLPENILIGDNDIRLIDFDDSGYGWHLFDLATCLFFEILGEEHFDEVVDSFVKAYRGERPLPDDHLEMLPTLLLARGFTYLGWVHTRRETDTAKELTGLVIEGVTALAEDYLGG
jgi:Ser/Thr protein kinase RdoA (MazF antagonist)